MKKEKLVKEINVRFTEKEYDTMMEAKNSRGFATMASYMHKCIVTHSKRDVKTIAHMDVIRIEKILKELRRIGVNVNQIAKRINSLNQIDTEIIRTMCKEIGTQLSQVESLGKSIENMLLKLTAETMEKEDDEEEKEEEVE